MPRDPHIVGDVMTRGVIAVRDVTHPAPARRGPPMVGSQSWRPFL